MNKEENNMKKKKLCKWKRPRTVKFYMSSK
jgi:hypothetical protein